MSGGFVPKGTGNMTVVPKEKHPAWKYFRNMIDFNTKMGIGVQINIEDDKSGWFMFWEVYKQGFEMGYGEAVHESCGSKQENKEGGKNGREV